MKKMKPDWGNKQKEGNKDLSQRILPGNCPQLCRNKKIRDIKITVQEVDKRVEDVSKVTCLCATGLV